jgi:NADH-quinone oxidoreductase subunit M
MFQRVMFGENTNPLNHHLKDMSKREWALLVPMVIFIVWIGVYPSTFMKISENSTKSLVNKLYDKKFGQKPFDLPVTK